MNSEIGIVASFDVQKALPENVTRFFGINLTYDGYLVAALSGAALEPLGEALRPAGGGRATIAQLGASKLPTQELPVVFDKDAARSIVGLFAGCILGGSIWRKSSYLLDRVGSKVASELVSIVDDPLLVRGLILGYGADSKA